MSTVKPVDFYLWKRPPFLVKLHMLIEVVDTSYPLDALELPEVEIDENIGTGVGLSSKVVLFNDEIHTFDEVIGQLIKALGCGTQRAKTLTLEVHNRGKASVYEGDMPDCIRISSILEEIGLHTQIEV